MKSIVCCLVLCLALSAVYAEVTVSDPTAPFAQLGAEPLAAAEPTTVAPSALLDTTCTLPGGCGPTGRLPTKAKAAGGKKSKLDIALAAIKQDILVRNRQINDEKAWVGQVRKIVEQYNKKVKRVLSDVEKTKAEVKILFKKKKQIENLKIQRALEKKLKDANKDLATLKQALTHVKSKASEFSKTKNEIKKTIVSIHTQLLKLKGEKDPKKLRAVARKLSRDD